MKKIKNTLLNLEYEEYIPEYKISYLANIGDRVMFKENKDLVFGEVISLSKTGVNAYIPIIENTKFVSWNNILEIEKWNENF